MKILPPLLLLLVFITTATTSISKKHPTYDEPDHFRYGVQVLHGDSTRFDDSKMPVSVLNAIPAKLLGLLDRDYQIQEPYTELRLGRYVTIFFACLLALLVFYWSYRLYGYHSAVFSLSLYAFSPIVLAHSRLVTTDLYMAFFSLLALFLFWSFINQTNKKNLLFSSMSFGLAQVAKYSCILLAPIFLAIFLINKKFRFSTKLFLLSLLCFFLISLFIINSAFLFNQVGQSLESYKFQSQSFQSLQQSFIGSFPSLLAEPYLSGLDQVIYRNGTGVGRGMNYLLGTTSNEPNPNYYLTALLVKIPIATLIFILLAFCYYIRKHRNFSFFRNELFLLVPIISYFLYFNYFSKAQMGLRLMIAILPLLYIFAGCLFANFKEVRKFFKIGTITLIIYLGASSLSYYPHYLSYFNEFVLDRKMAYTIIVDSDLDWGQNYWLLQDYLKENPNTVFNPPHPVTGEVVISPNLLVHVVAHGHFKWYDWIRSNLKPKDHIGYSYLIYDIPNNVPELGLNE